MKYIPILFALLFACYPSIKTTENRTKALLEPMGKVTAISCSSGDGCTIEPVCLATIENVGSVVVKCGRSCRVVSVSK